MGSSRSWPAVGAAAGDLLLGARCPGCGQAWWGACTECRAALLRRVPGPTQPDPTPAGFPPTITAGPYDDRLRGLITAHKEDQALQLTPLLAQLLSGSVAALVETAGLGADDPLVLVPMPSSAEALRRRGFDATGALARETGRRLRRNFARVRIIGALVQRRGRLDQADLDAAGRRANLAGGLRPRRWPRCRLEDSYVVVLDDLVTTGASLTEAARVLRTLTPGFLGAATIGATRRWRRSEIRTTGGLRSQ